MGDAGYERKAEMRRRGHGPGCWVGATAQARTLVVASWVLTGAAGCGSADDKRTSDAGMDGGDADGLGASGRGGQGGIGGAGDDAGGAPVGTTDAMVPDASVFGACPGATMSIDPTILPECPMCEGARCVPAGLVPEGQADQLADCPNGTGKCVPDVLVATMGDYRPRPCHSLLGAEGRCLSVCIPSVGSQSDRLPRDVCGEGELCAPCFDPLTGASTGSCTIGCDPGPKAAPVTFDACCGGLATCVPDDLVPAGQRGDLSRDSCGKGELCVPKALAQDGSFVPPSCESWGGSEGRCLPACLPDIAAQADLLERGSCGRGHLCAPCYNPLTGAPTDACNVGGDPGPTEPPYTFPTCCEGTSGDPAGLCVPDELVPEGQRASLGRDSCEAGFSCAPRTFIDSNAKPKPCSSLDDAEGRCLPSCLPSVAAQKDILPRSSCPEDFLCAPCFDPLTGADSGACAINGDSPADPPYSFPACCEVASGEPLGVCLDPALIPDEQEGALGRDTCAVDRLCVPRAFTDSSVKPTPCTSYIDGFEGRCLPACLPELATQGNRLHQDGCAAGHVCAPCYDPVTGMATGACSTNGDAPATTAEDNVFARCCQVTGGAMRGYCIPKQADLIPMSQWGSLPKSTCSQSPTEHLCVPDVKVANADAPFPGCKTSADACADDGSFLIGSGYAASGSSGACLPECMEAPDGPVPADAHAGRGDCQNGELCVPCTITQCTLDGCLLCIVGSCSTGVCGDAATCP